MWAFELCISKLYPYPIALLNCTLIPAWLNSNALSETLFIFTLEPFEIWCVNCGKPLTIILFEPSSIFTWKKISDPKFSLYATVPLNVFSLLSFVERWDIERNDQQRKQYLNKRDNKGYINS